MSKQSYAEVGQRFTALVQALVDHGKAAGAAAQNTGAAAPFLPPKNGWSGDLTDLAGMAKPFDRDEHSTVVQRAIASAADSGVTGDLLVSALQADLLGDAERAFRLRHLTPTRARLHAGGRKRAAAADGGVYRKGFEGLVRHLLAAAKAPGV